MLSVAGNSTTKLTQTHDPAAAGISGVEPFYPKAKWLQPWVTQQAEASSYKRPDFTEDF